MDSYATQLYEVRKDVVCNKCGNKGAVQFYGSYFFNGVRGNAVISKYIEPSKLDNPYMSPAVGFGGTIPFECTNCGNTGLIDMDGLEGYRKAFTTIQKESEG